jgi:hypothetical protein
VRGFIVRILRSADRGRSFVHAGFFDTDDFDGERPRRHECGANTWHLGLLFSFVGAFLLPSIGDPLIEFVRSWISRSMPTGQKQSRCLKTSAIGTLSRLTICLLAISVMAWNAVKSAQQDRARYQQASTARSTANLPLDQRSGLDWQTASDSEKRQCCDKMLTTAIAVGILKSSIVAETRTAHGFRRYSDELVAFLNSATVPDSDQNYKTYANQKVATLAAVGMSMMGWTASDSASSQ